MGRASKIKLSKAESRWEVDIVSYVGDVLNAVGYIRQKVQAKPEIGIILGSGLGDLVEAVEDKVVLPYEEIPAFPVSTVKGHQGNLVFGRLEGRPVVLMQGRFHYYEGHPVSKVVMGARVLGSLGIHTLFVTNAAGGIGEGLEPGDLMVIQDHINPVGINPCIGEEVPEFGPRFFDMTEAYDRALIEVSRKVFQEEGVPHKTGVYAFQTGPSYETPAEIRMLKAMGADAVGMSTVPEVIAARQMGIKIFGVSCITNLAAGISKTPLSHQEVVETSLRVKEKFARVMVQMVKKA
jgi:purine-nucleoside phosphorylase